MPTHVAFLRAINLGARRKFPKDAIRAAAEQAGFTDVETYINTGNVRVSSRLRSRTRVEQALERAFRDDRGFEVPTIAFTPAELTAIAEGAAELAKDHQGAHFVSLLKHEPTPETVEQIEAAGRGGESARVSGRAVHLLLEYGYQGASLTNATVERLMGVATNRNLTVIRAVAERWGG